MGLKSFANARMPTLLMTDAGDYHLPAYAHFPRDPVRGEEIYKRWIARYTDHLR